MGNINSQTNILSEPYNNKVGSDNFSSTSHNSHIGYSDGCKIEVVEHQQPLVLSEDTNRTSWNTNRSSLSDYEIEQVDPSNYKIAANGSAKQQQRIEELFQSASTVGTVDSKKDRSTQFPFFSSCYRVVVKLWEFICGSSKVDLDPKLANQKLPQLHGVNGLSNYHGTCFLNTALQLLAQTVKINLEQGDCAENSANYKMMEAILKKMPTLMNLVNNTLLTERDLQALYREAACTVGEEKMYEFLSEEKISENQKETGYTTGGITRIYLHTLLYALEVPPVKFSTDENFQHEHYKADTETTTNLYFQKASEFSNAFQSSTSSTSSTISLVPPPPSCLNIYVTDHSEQKIENILKPLTLSVQKKENISYEPVMISVEPKNVPHTYTFLKKEGIWYEVNDDKIFAIPNEWENDLEQYCGQHAALIQYQKVQNNAATVATTTSLPQPSVKGQLQAQGIDVIDRNLYSLFGCPESFFVAHATQWTQSGRKRVPNDTK